MLVIIPRGGSGAGKSTWIKKNAPTADIFSADNFFLNYDTEKYEFDYRRIGEAHLWCFSMFMEFCQKSQYRDDGEKEIAVVDNTNTAIAEFAPYAQVALAFGHDLRIVTFAYDPVAAFKRNTHETPLVKCMEQHARLIEQTKFIPPWWDHQYALWDETWPYASIK